MVKALIILSSIFISLWAGIGRALAQQLPTMPVERPKTGLSLGVNLEGPIQRFFDSDKTAFSVVGHLSLAPKYFFRGEAGFENLTFSSKNVEERSYSYESNGSFLRAGLLFDIFNVDEKGNNDNIFLGLHYGFALQEHASGNYTIGNSYWGNFDGSLSKYLLNTHWVEISGGPRTELFPNFFMGWSVNLRIKVLQDNKEVLEPYSVPGFGRGDSQVNLGFSYVLEYMIPWGKREGKW